jgi:hypothetical protein
MKTIKLNFTKAIINSQMLGSENEHMLSQLFFTLDGVPYDCVVRQPHGENHTFETDPIEVELPKGFPVRINYGEFSNEAENYYRKAVGKSASFIRIEGGSNNMITNSTFVFPYSTTIHEAAPDGAW